MASNDGEEDATALAPSDGPLPNLVDEEDTNTGHNQLTAEERNRWLILHVSLPRTIMTRDLVDSRDTDSELNDVLSNMAWGTINPETREFVVSSEDPTLEPPHESLISYAEYTYRTYPADSNMSEEAREENLRMAEKLRTAFTCPGHPGVKFRPMFDQMVKNLMHSNKALMKAFDIKKVELCDATCEPDANRSSAHNIMRFGRHSILPSFWQLLIDLVQSGRRFSIVFRAYSQDQLNLFMQEYQAFCEGTHPAFNGQNRTQKPPSMDGTKGSKDFRLADANIGKWNRKEGRLEFPNRPSPEDVAWQKATAAAAEPAEAEPDSPEGSGVASHSVNFTPTSYQCPPYHDVHEGLQNHILGDAAEPPANAVAIVDDLDFWDHHGRASQAAKLLLVDHAGTLAETKVQHIFFDGQIGRESTRSVDVRDIVSGEPIPYTEAQDLFFHRVDFFKAVIDESYFIKAVAKCEQKMSDRVLRIRQMVDTFASEQEKPEIMKTLPPKEYLYRAIIPALVPALEACQRDRPADPIEFIAFYMLRHPKMYSKTLKA
jgi:hypothetical protein